ncbi:MAG TPA: DUF4149 domain-containing protein [Thermoanaerobaculia bacterium]|nr:DUF4149 domain-containing protein [Thermoanaerobaculia bacterium]
MIGRDAVALLAEQTIRFALALWVGGTLVAVIAAPVLFRGIASRDLAGDLFGEILRRFEAVKHLLSLALVVSVFVELEQGGRLGSRSTASVVAIFVAVATNVYLAMVLRPRMGYFRGKIGSFDTAGMENPWRARFDVLHRRSTRVLVLGWAAAAAALALRP